MDNYCIIEKLSKENACNVAENFTKRIPVYPDKYNGKGIVICGGGVTYFTNAWICIKMLRFHGCKLPIQLWYLGEYEVNKYMDSFMSALNVECVNAEIIRKKNPSRILNGWELKPYSILHSPFKEILFLDADIVPVKNPEYLFNSEEYLKHGAVFWPDYNRLGPDREIWELCGVPFRDEPEFETGQILINKKKCWQALNLTMWYNEHSDFYYKYIHGDKETFHMAFRKLNKSYAMPYRPINSLQATMCQHDFENNRIFQHRNGDKWSLLKENLRISGFEFEDICFKFLDELKEIWDGRITSKWIELSKQPEHLKAIIKKITTTIYIYNRVGYDKRLMSFLVNGKVGTGAAGCEIFWNIRKEPDNLYLDILSDKELTCSLIFSKDEIFRGKWNHYEKMHIELIPIYNFQ